MFHDAIRPIAEMLETRRMLDSTIWAESDTPQTAYGTSASESTRGNEEKDSGTSWTLTLSNIPGHGHIDTASFDVAVFDHQYSGCGDSGCGDSGCGDSGCGGSCCGGSCCGGSAPDDSADQFSFTLTVGDQSEDVTFSKTNFGWNGNDTAGAPGWGGGFTNLSFPHSASTATLTITPNLPSDNGYRNYTWTIGGVIEVGTDVWVTHEQDGSRDGQVPNIFRFHRDSTSVQPEKIYYSLGGDAYRGIDNGDGTFSPDFADYTGGTESQFSGTYCVTIPGGSDSVDVQLTPIVPYSFPESTDKIIVASIASDSPPANNVAYSAPNTQPAPATQRGAQKGLTVVGPSDQDNINIVTSALFHEACAVYVGDPEYWAAIAKARDYPTPSLKDDMLQLASQGSHQDVRQKIVKVAFPGILTFNGDDTVTIDPTQSGGQVNDTSHYRIVATWLPNDTNNENSIVIPGSQTTAASTKTLNMPAALIR